MAVYQNDSRHLVKRSVITGSTPTFASGVDFTDNTWLHTDTMPGEFYFNMQDEKLWIGNLSGFSQIPLIGSASTLNNFCTDGLTTSVISGCSGSAFINFNGSTIALSGTNGGGGGFGSPSTLFTEHIRIGNTITLRTGGTDNVFGSVTLTAGTAVVANTNITASSLILFTGQDLNINGVLRVESKTVGTSFTVSSTLGTDSGTTAYLIIQPY